MFWLGILTTLIAIMFIGAFRQRRVKIYKGIDLRLLVGPSINESLYSMWDISKAEEGIIELQVYIPGWDDVRVLDIENTNIVREGDEFTWLIS